MGARRRKRKHAQLKVSGNLAISPKIPEWERELLRAALTVMGTSDPASAREAVDAKR